MSPHISTFTNTDVLVSRSVTASVFGQAVWTRATGVRFLTGNAFSNQLGQNMIHFSRLGRSIWSHEAGGLRTRFTALPIPFYRHVAASLCLLDTTEPIFGRSKRPAASSRSNPGETLPVCHRVDLRGGIPSRPHLINSLTGLLSLIPCPDVDCRGFLT